MWPPISHDWGHHAAGEEKPHSRTSQLQKTKLKKLSVSINATLPDSVSDPGMDLPPVYVDGQILFFLFFSGALSTPVG